MSEQQIDKRELCALIEDLENTFSILEEMEENAESEPDNQECDSETERQLAMYGKYEIPAVSPNYLKLDTANLKLKERVLGFSGQFSRIQNGSLFFRDKSGLLNPSYVETFDIANCILPLIEYLLDESYEVDLVGSCDNDLKEFFVSGIHIREAAKLWECYS